MFNIFSKKPKTNALQPKVTIFIHDSHSKFLDDDVISELNNGSYDQLQIQVKNSDLYLENLHPKNKNAHIQILGGKNIHVHNCTLNYLSTNASDIVTLKETTIQIANIFNAKNVGIEDIQNMLTFSCPQANSLVIRRANVQLASDIPGLKRIDGGTVKNFAAPISSDNVKDNIKQIGDLYIAPQIKTDWYDSFCVYNGTTENFVLGYKNIPMSKNETSEEKIDFVKIELFKNSGLFFDHDKIRGGEILNQFVDAIRTAPQPE